MKHRLTTQLQTVHIKHTNLYSSTPFIYEKSFLKNRKNLACQKMLSGVIRGVYITPHVRVKGYHSFHSTTLSKSQITFYLPPVFVEGTQLLPYFLFLSNSIPNWENFDRVMSIDWWLQLFFFNFINKKT
jgi:hypothetical protein